MEDLLEIAATYGFPMVVAFYLLIRIEPLLRKLQKSIDTLVLGLSITKKPGLNQVNNNSGDIDTVNSNLEDIKEILIEQNRVRDKNKT